MHRIDEKGINVTHTERSIKTLSCRTGVFATLRATLPVKGISASSASLVVILALASFLAFAGTPALAAPPIVLGGGGSGAGQLSQPNSVAVYQVSGTVYVADTGNRRIDEFESNGSFVRAFGYGVVNGANELQTCTTATGCQEGVGGFFPTGVAVDNSTNPLDLSKGDVYVSSGAIEKFTPEGKLELAFGSFSNGNNSGGYPANIPVAVDASGNVWVGDLHRLDEFSPQGAFLSEINLPGVALVRLLTIDTDSLSPSFGDFYLSDRPIAGPEDETQKITAPGSGSYTLTFAGQTTTPLPFNATTSEIQGALAALSTIGAGNISVTSYPGEVVFLKFEGALGDTYLPLVTASAGSVTMAVEGASGHLLKVKPDGTTVETLDGSGEPSALGLDPATGNLFVSDSHGGENNSTLLEYAPSGVELESFGAGEVSGCCGRPNGNSLAFNDSANALYVTGGSVVQIFTLPPPGPVARGASTNATEIHKTTAILNATVDPEDKATTYHFQYITEQQYKEDGETFGTGTVTTPESGSIGEDFADHPASVAVTGLKLETTYRFRVIATNTNGTDSGETATFTTLPAVRIDSTSTSDITATSATLNAQVNPLGEPTTYHFEYLTEAAYLENGGSFSGPQQATIIPQPDGVVGSGVEAVEVSQHPQGLQLHTTYRYRVVAFDSVAPEGIVGPVLAFTTQGSGGHLVLPDGREWEMVSPPDKFGANVLGVGGGGHSDDMQASAAGDAITYLATAPTEGEPAGNSNFTQVLSTRGSSGWGSGDIAIPHGEATGLSGLYSEFPYFSEDLSLVVTQPFRAFDPSLSGEASEQTAYVRTDYLHGDVSDRCVESCYRPLVTGAPGFENVPPGTEFGICEGAGLCNGLKSNQCPPAFHCGPQFEAASTDLAHIVVRSQVPLTQGAPKGLDNVERADLFEWSGGQLTYVGQGVVGTDEAQRERSVSRHAVSEDGSRIVILGESEGLQGLLVRDTARGETVKLDAVQGGSGQGKAEPVFQTASSDGSKVFFTDTQRLTGDAGATVGAPDLYECQVVEVGGKLACDLRDLTPEHSGENGDVYAPILGASADGSSVYFVAKGVLTGTEENEHGEKAQGGQPNLYLNHDGVPKLIAVLSPEDIGDWGHNYGHPGNFQPAGGLIALTGRVSPDGRWLAFMSERSLTGYVNQDASSGKPDEEVYLYHAPTGAGDGTLVCASCNPTGARPHGVEYARLNGGLATGQSGSWENGQWLAANIPGWTASWLYQSRYLSDSGRLFFNSSDALVPQDTNGTEDVYEYEPQGVGDCSESSSTFDRVSRGCVGLISSGTSPGESGFMDASESGGDVFFLTAAELSSRDTDSALDVYDAHQCSASAPCFPAPPAPSPACEGDACQSPVAAPEDPTPGSLTFSGPGNPVSPAATVVVRSKAKSKPTKCRKGFVKKKAKCVRKLRAKKAGKSAKGRK